LSTSQNTAPARHSRAFLHARYSARFRSAEPVFSIQARPEYENQSRLYLERHSPVPIEQGQPCGAQTTRRHTNTRRTALHVTRDRQLHVTCDGGSSRPTRKARERGATHCEHAAAAAPPSVQKRQRKASRKRNKKPKSSPVFHSPTGAPRSRTSSAGSWSCHTGSCTSQQS
jgi:hypothetical protein